MLLSSHIFTFVNRAVSPTFFTVTVLQIISPVTFVHGTVDVVVHTIAIGLIVDPIALVNVAVDMSELAFTMCPIIFPFSFISGTIWPLLLSVTISETTDPLSSIRCTCFKSVSRPLFSFGMWIIRSVFRYGFPALFDGEIARISPFGFHYESCVPPRQMPSEQSLELNNEVHVLSIKCHVEWLAICAASSTATCFPIAAHIIVKTIITFFHSAFPIVDTSHALLFHLTQVPVALVSLRVVAIVLACFDLLLRVDLVIVAAARVALEAHCYP